MHKKDRTTTKLCIVIREQDHGRHGSGLLLSKYYYIPKTDPVLYKGKPKILKIHVRIN